MNFQQLKIIREAARQDYNLTEVANMLFTSQSGVSRHIRELEDELGIEIFVPTDGALCAPVCRAPSGALFVIKFTRQSELIATGTGSERVVNVSD